MTEPAGKPAAIWGVSISIARPYLADYNRFPRLRHADVREAGGAERVGHRVGLLVLAVDPATAARLAVVATTATLTVSLPPPDTPSASGRIEVDVGE